MKLSRVVVYNPADTTSNESLNPESRPRMVNNTVEVAVPLPIRGTFSYLLPEPGTGSLPEPGSRVLVPFQQRHLIGIVVATGSSDRKGLKTVLRCLDERPLISRKLVELGRWISWYYLAPLGESYRVMLPPGVLKRKASPDRNPEDYWPARTQQAVVSVRDEPETLQLTEKQRETLRMLQRQELPVLVRQLVRELSVSPAVLKNLEAKGLVGTRPINVYRSPWQDVQVGEACRHQLTEEQAAALKILETAVREGGFQSILLHGVTASGKTEIYLNAIESVLIRGKTGLVLVPEIALTPQVTRQFRAWFGHRVAILHSALSDGERFDQWRRIRSGHARVVVGTRSAVFAPLDNLGLIIVDEEHDTSYKQGETPRYNARDTAVKRAQLENALVVLGSATPALETYFNAVKRNFPRYFVLKNRIGERPLPTVHLVDMRVDFEKRGKSEIVSEFLKELIEDRLTKGEQALILLNRRGYATSCLCRSCGHFETCENCSITLTFHRETNRLACHYCGYSRSIPASCPECRKPFVFFAGYGTEKVQEALGGLFPGAVIDRLDRDTVQRKGSYERILGGFRKRKTDILVGTQMLAKGHDFPSVTLVGVLGADQGLKFADFRAAERTFQLLTQVAGRAGRGSIPGDVVIQTFYPNHYSLRFACTQEYEQFSRQELAFRRNLRYPPFVAIAAVLVRDSQRENAWSTARIFARIVTEARDRRSVGRRLRVFGPAAAPIERLKNDYRIQLLLKSNDRILLHDILIDAVRQCAEQKIDLRRIAIDVDPVDLM